MRGIYALCVCLTLVACGQPSYESSTPSVNGAVGSNSQVNSSGAGAAAFKTGFYSFANSQGCVKCHGSIVSPKFASPDFNEAYAQARGNEIGSTKPLIEFASPNASIFAVYAGNSHCGDAPCSNPANTAVVQGLLATWAAAELAGGSNTPTQTGGSAPPKFVTVSLTIPANLAAYNAAANTPLRFNLNQLANAETGGAAAIQKLNNAILEIEARYANISMTNYRFIKPKIIGASATVTVVGLHIFSKGATEEGIGVEDTQQTQFWNNVGKPTPVTAAVVARPNTLPTTPINANSFVNTSVPLTTVTLPVIGAGDMITIGFEVLQ